ncbi:MAG TPA: PQQ-binding-like beta-propeller repeat protein [Fimbriimonadaceae bacterium]|nr:PQQ-binding-like beta-propeller repeat protein [Fimbriimonadaceae bacterium]
MLGHPIVYGETFMALSQDDLYVNWHPGSNPNFITIAHPFPGTPEPDLTPVAMLGGFPLAMTPSGIFFGDDQVSPFMTVLSSAANPVWERDIINRLGIPAVQGGTIFTNVGGDRALSSIVALNSSNGQTQWECAPIGFPREPLGFVTREKVRPATPKEQATLQAIRNTMAKRGLGGSAQTREDITESQSTPGIDAEHGHWLNPGLVVAEDRVYGEIGQKIVALSQASGDKAWQFQLDPGEIAHSIAASRDYLFVSLDKRLIALNLESGKLEWSEATPGGGTLTIADGLVMLSIGTPEPEADGGQILVFGSGAATADSKAATKLPPPPPK